MLFILCLKFLTKLLHHNYILAATVISQIFLDEVNKFPSQSGRGLSPVPDQDIFHLTGGLDHHLGHHQTVGHVNSLREDADSNPLAG